MSPEEFVQLYGRNVYDINVFLYQLSSYLVFGWFHEIAYLIMYGTWIDLILAPTQICAGIMGMFIKFNVFTMINGIFSLHHLFGILIGLPFVWSKYKVSTTRNSIIARFRGGQRYSGSHEKIKERQTMLFPLYLFYTFFPGIFFCITGLKFVFLSLISIYIWLPIKLLNWLKVKLF